MAVRKVAITLPEERIVRVQTPPWHGPDFGWNSKYWRELGAPWFSDHLC